MNHHTTDLECSLCRDKLDTADPKIADWFLEIKKKFPQAHISWAYRGKTDQNRMFTEGKSRAKFPNSKHNRELDGKCYSQALDLFELKGGRAFFDQKFYFALNEYSKSLGFPITWGGEFRKIIDYDHFEI